MTEHPSLAWRRRAAELTDWVLGHLPSRLDVWGGYVPPRYRKPGGDKVLTKPRKSKRGIETLTRSHVMAHFRGYDAGDVIGLHTTGPNDTCRFGAIEIDRHTDLLPIELTTAAAHFWYEKATSLGFHPLLIDSDGKGGFHVIIVFADPIPAAIAYWFFRWLARDWRGLNLPKRPETFPKQPALNGRFGNWLRLVGRHHTREHWARLWDGSQWLEGYDAIDLVLACKGDDQSLIPADAAPPRPEPVRPARPLPANVGDVVKRCSAYIRRLPPAVSGEHGHDATFHAACEIFRFGLDGSDAKFVLEHFNAEQTSGGRWSDEELEHKLKGAKAAVIADRKFGCRLREDRRRRDELIGSALQRQSPGWRHSAGPTLTIAPLRCVGGDA